MLKNKDSLKILTILDPHAADKNPGARIDSYKESFFDKLNQISKIVSEKGIDLVIIAGDVFSIKVPLKNSHELASRITETLLKFDCKVCGILGNHDLLEDRLISWKTQPISHLIRSKSLTLLDWRPLEYILSTGKTVRVRGSSYNTLGSFDPMKDEKGSEDVLIHVSHMAVTPDGGTYDKYGEYTYSYKELARTPPDIFVLGHIHTDFGITNKLGKTFVQNGSLMRSTTHCYNLKRDVKVGLIEVSSDGSYKTEEILLNIKPSSEVFDLEKKKRIEAERKHLDAFLQGLESVVDEAVLDVDDSLETLTVSSLIEKLNDVEVSREELNSLFLHFMEQVT